jgi:hypothetical protein
MPRETLNRQEFKRLIKEVKASNMLEIERTTRYYRLGRYLKKGYVTNRLSNEVKRAARRTYEFFKGAEIVSFPTPRDLQRMNEQMFRQALHHAREFRRILTEQASLVGETVLTSDHNLENLAFNADQIPSPNLEQELLTALTQNDETIQHNFTIIDDVTQVLDNHLAEVIHDDPEETILRRPHDEASLAAAEAVTVDTDDNAVTAVNADDVVTADTVNNADTVTSPPAYSPTRAWMYEPIIALDSDSDAQ